MCLVCNYLGDLYEAPIHETGKKELASKGRKKENQTKAK